METVTRPHRSHQYRRPAAATLSDAELDRELTLTAAARTRARKRRFDVLYRELERRRRVVR